MEAVSIMHANRVATDNDKARAWDSLMSFAPYDSTNVDARAIQHAADTLCDIVAYRTRNS